MDFGEKAMDVALRAACEASRDAYDAHLPLNEVTDRNEPWTTSYIGCRLNDAARDHYEDTKKGIRITYEPRTSWMDFSTGDQAQPGRSPFTEAQRFDIAVWDNADAIEGLLEIKNAPGMDSARFTADADRLRYAIDRWGAKSGRSVRWGLMLFSCRLTTAQSSRDKKAELTAALDRREALLRDCLAERLIKPDRRFLEMDAQAIIAWGGALIR